MGSRALTLLPWTLGLWAVGVQTHEVLATAGAWATAVAALVAAWPLRGVRPWALLLAFVATSLVAPLVPGHLPTGTGLARLSDWLVVPAAAFAAARLDERALSRVALAAATVLVVSVGVAGLQHFGAWPSAEAFSTWAWTRLPFSRVYETVPGRSDRFMAGGLLLHRLKFANVTAVACVAAAAAVAWRVPRWRLFAIAGGVGLVGLTWFPHARAASMAVLGAVFVVWVAAARRRGRAALSGGLVVVAALGLILAVPSLRTRFASSLTGEGSGERTAITGAGLNAIVESPLGVGLDRFRPGLYATADAPAQAREHHGKAHNQFVTIAAEAGVPAVVLLLLVLGVWLRRALLGLPQGALAAGAIALFVALSLLHDPLFHPESSLALMLLLGTGLGAINRESPSPSRAEALAPGSPT